MKLNELLKENAGEELISIAKIEAWMQEMKIEDYTINNGVVDVDGDVNISHRDLTQLPIQFGEVSGYFDCSFNKLTSLVGCPTRVGQHFMCNKNRLTTLVGGPAFVEGLYDCGANELITLEGAAAHVGRYFNCSNNGLTTLDGAPAYVGVNFYCQYNKLTTLLGIPTHMTGFHCLSNNIKSHAIGLLLVDSCTYFDAEGDWVPIIIKYLGRPDDIFECQAELIEHGFEEYAQL